MINGISYIPKFLEPSKVATLPPKISIKGSYFNIKKWLYDLSKKFPPGTSICYLFIIIFTHEECRFHFQVYYFQFWAIPNYVPVDGFFLAYDFLIQWQLFDYAVRVLNGLNGINLFWFKLSSIFETTFKRNLIGLSCSWRFLMGVITNKIGSITVQNTFFQHFALKLGLNIVIFWQNLVKVTQFWEEITYFK